MRIRIRHETSYRYAEPASSTLQLLRLTPRPHDGQFVRRWRVAVDADARLERSEDAYGNITHLVFVHGPVEAVTITIDGEVDTRDTHGALRGGVERQPVGLFLRETALTRVSPALRRFARETSAGQGGDQLAAVHALTRTLHKSMKFTVGATHSDTTAAEAFDAKSGICQDFTHILLAAARALGPAEPLRQRLLSAHRSHRPGCRTRLGRGLPQRARLDRLRSGERRLHDRPLRPRRDRMRRPRGGTGARRPRRRRR